MSTELGIAIAGAILFPLYLLIFALCKSAARGNEHDEEADTRPWNQRGGWR